MTREVVAGCGTVLNLRHITVCKNRELQSSICSSSTVQMAAKRQLTRARLQIKIAGQQPPPLPCSPPIPVTAALGKEENVAMGRATWRYGSLHLEHGVSLCTGREGRKGERQQGGKEARKEGASKQASKKIMRFFRSFYTSELWIAYEVTCLSSRGAKQR